MAHDTATTMHTDSGYATLPRHGWFAQIMTLLQVRRTRIDLANLTDTQLHDIGLSRQDVQEELSRPIWDVPRNWRR